MSLDEHNGPEWLDNQADRLAGQSLDAEAQQASRLAETWRDDRKTIDQLQDENTRLQRRVTDLERRLDTCARASQRDAVPA